MNKDQLTFYIDESCHLEHDHFPVMCIGYIKVPKEQTEEMKQCIKAIKRRHNILHEIKWNTISNTHIDMYKELIDYFFDSNMEFRCILVKYKDRLDNLSFNNGEHDNFYYKMIYYLLVNPYTNPSAMNNYRVFLDIKDTKGRAKLNKIQEVFSNKFHGKSPFLSFQHIRSHESQFIQLADFFIGAVTYKARGLHLKKDGSLAKKELINYIEMKSGYVLDEGTEPGEIKFNIFDHQPRKRNDSGR